MTTWVALCVSSSENGWGQVEGTLSAAWQTGVLREAASDWVLMTLVMVPALNLPLIRFVAVRTFAARRASAVVEFLFGLLAVWILAGVALVPIVVLCVVLVPVHEVTASLAFGFAALWQMTPMKRSALQRCHRTVALKASSWRADRDCVAFGLRTAGQCVTSCWATMFACALVSHSLAALIFVQAISMHERAAHAPQLSRYAFLLAGFAAVLALPKSVAL